MKHQTAILASLALVVLAPALFAQVEIEEVPLTWKQVALGDGEALYIELCAVCHGADATGKGPAAPALATPVPDLTRLARDNDGTFPSAAVEKAINGETEILAHGTQEMPIWGAAFEDLRPDIKPSHREAFARLRVHNLMVYLETVQAD